MHRAVRKMLDCRQMIARRDKPTAKIDRAARATGMRRGAPTALQRSNPARTMRAQLSLRLQLF
jgi:hypothetical protein